MGVGALLVLGDLDTSLVGFPHVRPLVQVRGAQSFALSGAICGTRFSLLSSCRFRLIFFPVSFGDLSSNHIYVVTRSYMHEGDYDAPRGTRYDEQLWEPVTIPKRNQLETTVFLPPYRPPQLENRDTHHAHERSNRFVIHEWEGLRNVASPDVQVEMTQAPTYLTAYTKIGNPRRLSRRYARRVYSAEHLRREAGEP